MQRPVGASTSARRKVAQQFTVVLAEKICSNSLTMANCTVTARGIWFSKSCVQGTSVR